MRLSPRYACCLWNFKPFLLPVVACLIINPSIANAQLVDIIASGYLKANESLSFEVRFRLDVTAPPSSSDDISSIWFNNQSPQSQVIIEIEGHVNNQEFYHSDIDLILPSSFQFLGITDHEAGFGSDSILLSATSGVPSLFPEVGLNLIAPDGDSSLTGSSIPTDQSMLLLETFETRDFVYINNSGQTGIGIIENLSVTNIPAPSGLLLLAGICAYPRRR